LGVWSVDRRSFVTCAIEGHADEDRRNSA
jgi:hypothetical protein